MTAPPDLEALLAGPVLEVAPRLLGAVLRHGEVAVRITEVEAYDGPADPGSHAAHGRTARNAVMFGPPAHLYVYFTYGMHHCCNVVCGPEGTAAAVLLRAGEVVDGLEVARVAASCGADGPGPGPRSGPAVPGAGPGPRPGRRGPGEGAGHARPGAAQAVPDGERPHRSAGGPAPGRGPALAVLDRRGAERLDVPSGGRFVPTAGDWVTLLLVAPFGGGAVGGFHVVRDRHSTS